MKEQLSRHWLSCSCYLATAVSELYQLYFKIVVFENRPNIPPMPLFTGLPRVELVLKLHTNPTQTPHFSRNTRSQILFYQNVEFVWSLCGVSKKIPHLSNPLYIDILGDRCGMWSLELVVDTQTNDVVGA